MDLEGKHVVIIGEQFGNGTATAAGATAAGAKVTIASSGQSRSTPPWPRCPAAAAESSRRRSEASVAEALAQVDELDTFPQPLGAAGRGRRRFWAASNPPRGSSRRPASRRRSPAVRPGPPTGRRPRPPGDRRDDPLRWPAAPRALPASPEPITLGLVGVGPMRLRTGIAGHHQHALARVRRPQCRQVLPEHLLRRGARRAAMIGTGMNPASLMARAVLARSARSAPSGNAQLTEAPSRDDRPGRHQLAEFLRGSFQGEVREQRAASGGCRVAVPGRRPRFRTSHERSPVTWWAGPRGGPCNFGPPLRLRGQRPPQVGEEASYECGEPRRIHQERMVSAHPGESEHQS